MGALRGCTIADRVAPDGAADASQCSVAQSLEELVRATVAGDANAWRALGDAIVPQIQSIARAHRGLRSRGLAQSSDDVAEVTTRTLERLTRDNHRNLVRYLAQLDERGADAAQSFDSWLYGSIDFVIREHLRIRFGRAPKPAADDAPTVPRPSRRDLGTNAQRIDQDPTDRSELRALGLTARLSVAEILSYIDAEFDQASATALRMYYAEERGFAEIASALGLAEARDAEKLIRRLNARLRYRFAPGA
jgi:hypothetical protein